MISALSFSRVSLASVRQAFVAAGRVTSSAYGINLLLHGLCLEKENPRALVDAVAGVALLALAGGSLRAGARLGVAELGSLALACAAMNVAGACREKVGIIPGDKYHYCLVTNAPSVFDIAWRTAVGLALHRLAGNDLMTTARLTSLYFGGRLIFMGARYTNGLLRDKHNWKCIPADKKSYCTKTPKSDGDQLYAHMAAMIAGFALITFINAKL
jgi:hypothetical protein